MGTFQYEINEEMSQRINIMKFIFMIMVVFIHSTALPELPFEIQVPQYVAVLKEVVTNGISAVAIPGFFFISGFLLFSKDFSWSQNIKKKICNIGVPYIIINSFWILFFKLMQSIPITAPLFAGESYQIVGISGVIRAYFAPIPLYYPFWFLRDLFILNVFAGVIKTMINKLPIISMLIMIGVSINIISIPILVSNTSLCMFMMGYYVVKYRLDWRNIEQVNIWEMGAAFFVVTIYKLCVENSAFVMPFYSIVGILFWYRMSGVLAKCRIMPDILWCSQFTFFVYGFHEFYEAMIKKIMMMIIPQYGIVQCLEFFMLPVAVTVSCIVIGAFTKKHMPLVYNTLCGHRSFSKK